MASFFSEKDTRYRDALLGKYFVPKGTRFLDSDLLEIAYQGNPIFGFFKFDRGDKFPEYAAALGVGILTLKVFSPPKDAPSLDKWEALVTLETLWPTLLGKHGIDTPLVFDVLKDDKGQVTIVKDYRSGPTVDQLWVLHKMGELNKEKWDQAISAYNDFLIRLESLRSLPEIQELAQRSDLIPQHWGHPDNILYIDGKWTLVSIANPSRLQ
jgi:hypothetical protein